MSFVLRGFLPAKAYPSWPPAVVPVDMREGKEQLTTPSHSRSYGKHGYYGARTTERHLLLILCEYKPIAMEPPPDTYHGSIAHHIVIFIVMKVLFCFSCKSDKYSTLQVI